MQLAPDPLYDNASVNDFMFIHLSKQIVHSYHCNQTVISFRVAIILAEL